MIKQSQKTQAVVFCFALTITMVSLVMWQAPKYCITISQAASTSTSSPQRTENFEDEERTEKKKTDAVILLSMIRSGSSIIGSIFNERENVFYLYEPLFPFGLQKCDEKTREDSLRVLNYTISCQYEKLSQLYQPSTRNDVHAG